MKFDLLIPTELAHLKRDKRGYPIPFFVSTKNGEPQFQLLSGEKQRLCVDNKLCPICGKKLYKEGAYFICGPIGLHNRVSTDPPMHRVCAEFSLQACPHLYFEKAQRREVKGMEDGPPNKEHMAPKSQELFLAKASKFWFEKAEVGPPVIVFALVSWQRYPYVNGFLEIDNSPEGRGGTAFQLSAEKEYERSGAGINAVLKSLNPKGKK